MVNFNSKLKDINCYEVITFLLFLSQYVNGWNKKIPARFSPLFLIIYITIFLLLYRFYKGKTFAFNIIEKAYLVFLLFFGGSCIVGFGEISDIAISVFKDIPIIIYLILWGKIAIKQITKTRIEEIIYWSGLIGCVINLIVYINSIFTGSSYGNFFGRLTGIVGGDPNYIMLSFVVFFAICLVKNGFKYFCGLVLCVLCAVLSMSRGTMLAFFMAFLFSSISSEQIKLRFKQTVFFMLIFVILFPFFYTINPTLSNALCQRLHFSNLKGGAGRTKLWSLSIDTFDSNMAFGIGIGNTASHNFRVSRDFRCNHNSLLDAFIESGLVGGCLYLVFWSCLLLWILKSLFSRRNINYSCFLLTGLIAFFIQFLFLSYCFTHWQFVLYLSLFNVSNIGQIS